MVRLARLVKLYKSAKMNNEKMLKKRTLIVQQQKEVNEAMKKLSKPVKQTNSILSPHVEDKKKYRFSNFRNSRMSVNSNKENSFNKRSIQISSHEALKEKEKESVIDDGISF